MARIEDNDRKTAEYLRARGWGILEPGQFRPDMEDEFLELWEQIKPFTMVSAERAYGLWQAVRYVVENRIPGDFAECGVWKGGCCMLIALTLQQLKASPRVLWLYDTFAGMPVPDDNDIISSTGQPMKDRWEEGLWAVDDATVSKNLAKTGYREDLFRLVKGDVEQTLLQSKPDKIALLRLDTDWYQSTKTELEQLYPLLQKNGILIIDDYGHFSGARKAVDEYFSGSGYRPLLFRTDYTGRMTIKRD